MKSIQNSIAQHIHLEQQLQYPYIGLCIPSETILSQGFPSFLPVESWAIMFWHSASLKDLDKIFNLWQKESAKRPISSLSLYGNPLAHNKKGIATQQGWENLISMAPKFNTDTISGFTGRVPYTSWEDSLDAYALFFRRIGLLAKEQNLKIAFENCRMQGTYKTGNFNLAFTPEDWSRLFSILDMDHIGLEWDPSHLLESMIDPYVNFITWSSRIFHIHGKCGKIKKGMLSRSGIFGNSEWFQPVYPSEGTLDWEKIFKLMAESQYQGFVSIEDPIYGQPDYKKIEDTYTYLCACRSSISLR